MSDFKNELKKWRLSKQMIMKEAANELGLNIRTYEGYELGKKPREFVRRFIESKISRT